MAIVEEGEYKGNKMLILKKDEQDKYPFQFGLKKAELLLDCIPEITEWVEKQNAGKKKDIESEIPFGE